MFSKAMHTIMFEPIISFKPEFLQITSLSLTPVMVGERPENIPYMNIAWFIPAIIGSILTAAKVKVSPFHTFYFRGFADLAIFLSLLASHVVYML